MEVGDPASVGFLATAEIRFNNADESAFIDEPIGGFSTAC